MITAPNLGAARGDTLGDTIWAAHGDTLGAAHDIALSGTPLATPSTLKL